MTIHQIDPFASKVMRLSMVQEYLGCSRATLYRWMKQEGGIPARRLGRHWVCIKHELDSWVASQPGINLPSAG